MYINITSNNKEKWQVVELFKLKFSEFYFVLIKLSIICLLIEYKVLFLLCF